MRFPIRRPLIAVGLVAAWCALWGEVTFANVASGVVLAAAISMSHLGNDHPGGLRIVPLVRFAALVAVDLVVSTVQVAREVLTPTDYTAEAIIAVDVPMAARSHFLLLVVAVTLTPGTAVVDGDPDTGRLYLHLLHAERRDEVEAHVRRLAELACAALPVPEPVPAPGRVEEVSP